MKHLKNQMMQRNPKETKILANKMTSDGSNSLEHESGSDESKEIDAS